MKLFFDTSALFKLYHKEDGTDELMEFLGKKPINAIYLSEIAEIEFSSAVWKKCRKKEINENIARTIIESFDHDLDKFRFVTQNLKVRNSAKSLISKYWSEGLRTLDSIQMASALHVKSDIEYFLSSDNLLNNIAVREGFKVEI